MGDDGRRRPRTVEDGGSVAGDTGTPGYVSHRRTEECSRKLRESHRHKVLVERKRLVDPLACHYLEAHGIRQGQLLIVILLDPRAECRADEIGRHIQPFVQGIVEQGGDDRPRSSCIGAVQEMRLELGENQRGANEAPSRLDYAPGYLHGTRVVLIARIGERQERARVN